MKQKWTKKGIAAVCMAVAMVLTGCSGGERNTAEKEGTVELDYWIPLSAVASTLVSSLADVPMYQKLQEDTGIKLNFIHPTRGSEAEKFNLLMASEDLPDMIQYNWPTYLGGTQKAIDDGVIVDIYDYKDMAPNYCAYLDSNPDVKKMIETSEGSLFAFAFVRGDESLCVSWGLTLRKDWLDELGLAVPETIDEWETVLRAFKQQKGAQAPLCITTEAFKNGQFTGAYHTILGYYVDQGTVQYGMLSEGFKDFVTKMHSWYEEGLLDNNFALLDKTTIDSNILNGVSGAAGMALGGGIGKYLTATTDENFDLVGAPSPVLTKGQRPEFGYCQPAVPSMTCAFTAVAADSEKIEDAVRLLDYGYSEEGHMLYNFGIEGESYEMVDGYPTYTELITNNPDGYTMNVMLSQYTEAYDAGPFVQDKRYMEQYSSKPQQIEAWNTWTQTNMKEHVLPNLSVLAEEQNELALLDNSIDTYAAEILTKLIIGTESLDNFDKVIEEFKNRGIDRALEIRRNAYERYLEK